MNLSIRQSLFLGFGVILVLFILNSVYVSYETRKIHAIEERLLENRVPSVLAGEKLLDGIDLSLAGLGCRLGKNRRYAGRIRAIISIVAERC